MPDAGLKLTPRHYTYLKISEGCNHRCSFCIIPSLRGDLASRRPDAILREAEKLVAAGTKELLVISQDTSAYGVDLRHASWPWKGGEVRAHMTDLARELGKLGAWVRLHYVYPYPHVDKVIPLMAEGLVLPYLDIPFQHASPKVLKAMKRPANEAKVLERIRAWREICPDIAIRSTFIVGFPGETDEDFDYLLDWLDEAQLDRVGAFRFEPVGGAAANALPGAVPEEVKEERYARFMEKSAAISAAKLAAKVGRTIDVIIDAVDPEGGATGRSKADAPEIDGEVHLRDAGHLAPGRHRPGAESRMPTSTTCTACPSPDDRLGGRKRCDRPPRLAFLAQPFGPPPSPSTTLPSSTPPKNEVKADAIRPASPIMGLNRTIAPMPPAAPARLTIHHQGSGCGGRGPRHQPGHFVPHQPIMAANANSIIPSL